MARKCLGLVLAAVVLAGGCVERELTIKTVPTGATIVLNDEEIGQSPVTTSFQWYGDYRVRASMPGYETLVTHKAMERPLHDKFPFDFFAQVLWPGTIKDKYEWTFELQPYQEPTREALISKAMTLKQEAVGEANSVPASTDANSPAKAK